MYTSCHAARNRQSSNCIDLSHTMFRTSTKIQTQTADIKRAPPHASRTRQICRFSQPILIHIRNHAGSTLQGPTGRRQTGTDWYIVSTLLLMTTISLLASYHKLHLSYQHHQRSMLVTLVLQLRGRMATVMMKTPFHHRTLSTVS